MEAPRNLDAARQPVLPDGRRLGAVAWPSAAPLLPEGKALKGKEQVDAQGPDEMSLRRPPVQHQLVLGFSNREFTQLGNEIGLQAT